MDEIFFVLSFEKRKDKGEVPCEDQMGWLIVWVLPSPKKGFAFCWNFILEAQIVGFGMGKFRRRNT